MLQTYAPCVLRTIVHTWIRSSLLHCGVHGWKLRHNLSNLQVYPLRLRGNMLLCTLLLGNVVINNTLAVFLDQLMGGIVAIVASSAAIVLFAEIIPQAVFGRHRLWTGSHLRHLTWVFFYLMSPLTYPISKVLDCILGDELGVAYSRDELRQLLQETHVRSKLDHQEVNILRGALEVCIPVVFCQCFVCLLSLSLLNSP
jgi:CBS domain containing-hemolysin-like protein